MILEGLTEQGAVVPVQVTEQGRIVAEGLPGDLSSAPPGTAVTPGIAFTGDPNTGVYSPGADQVAISTGGIERARIDSSGRLLVGITTANTSGAKLQTVDGITFPATQVASANPNTLDDYEEGTWTPIIIGTTTAGTVTYLNRTATYTKVGRLIHVSVHVEWSGGTGAGTLRISGLPFTPSAFGALAVGQTASIAAPAGTWLTAQINPSAAAIVPIYNYTAGSGNSVEIGYDAAGTLIAGGTYPI